MNTPLDLVALLLGCQEVEVPAGEHVAVAAEVDPAQAVGALGRSSAHVTVLLHRQSYGSGLKLCVSRQGYIYNPGI